MGLSWSGIFGGAFAALAIWAMLWAFGLAIGLTALDPEAGVIRGAGIFTGVWGIIAPLIALFCGGLVVGQASGAIARRAGALHGLVTWALVTFVGAWALGAFLFALVGGTFQAGAAATTGVDDMAEAVGVNAEAAFEPVNQRLQAQGLPTIAPEELRAAAADAARTALQTGQLERGVVVQSLTRNTALSAAEAREVAGEVEVQVQQAMSDARTAGAQVAETSGRVFWGVFGVLLIGMLAAVGGAILGRAPRMRLWSAALSTEGAIMEESRAEETAAHRPPPDERRPPRDEHPPPPRPS
ncbi:MAG: hypothetical protein ACOCXM_05925 [Myxococcota bacterium]